MTKKYYSLNELTNKGCDLSMTINVLLEVCQNEESNLPYVFITLNENINLEGRGFWVRISIDNLREMEVRLNKGELVTDICISHSGLNFYDGVWPRSLENYDSNELEQAIDFESMQRFIKRNPKNCESYKDVSDEQYYVQAMETVTQFFCDIRELFIKANNDVFNSKYIISKLGDEFIFPNKEDNELSRLYDLCKQLGLNDLSDFFKLFDKSHENCSVPLIYGIESWFDSHVKKIGNQKIGHSTREQEKIQNKAARDGIFISPNLIEQIAVISNADINRPKKAINKSLEENSTPTMKNTKKTKA